MSSAASRSAQEKANLARIRDNQRRSRARRKEYLQELENRVRQCELQGIEASTEIQIAARRVSDENRKLRQLLNQSGIFDDMIEHHLATTVPSDGTGGTGQAAALLEELLQPRKPVGPAGATFVGLSVGTMGEHGRGVSRDTSVGSMSTSQSSVWDQPMASVPSSSGHKRHLSTHSQNASHSSSSITAKANQPNERNSPTNHRGNMLAPNQGQHMQMQSPAGMSPTTANMNPSPVYDFDSHANDPYDSNNFYFQPTHSPNPNFELSPPPAQQASPNPLYRNIQPQSQQSLTQSDPEANSQNASPGNNHGADRDLNFESTLMNTSSCLFAADMIGTIQGRRGEDVMAELGCGNGGEDCDVSDEVVFGVLERYS